MDWSSVWISADANLIDCRTGKCLPKKSELANRKVGLVADIWAYARKETHLKANLHSKGWVPMYMANTHRSAHS